MNRMLGKTIVALLVSTLTVTTGRASAADLAAAARDAAEDAVAQQRRRAGQDDWERRYEKAEERKGGGKKKMVLGAIVLGSGIALRQWAASRCVTAITTGSGTCGMEATLANAGGALDLAGVGVIAWGLVQYISANGELKRLDDQRPAGDSTAALSMPAIAPMAAYTVRW